MESISPGMFESDARRFVVLCQSAQVRRGDFQESETHRERLSQGAPACCQRVNLSARPRNRIQNSYPGGPVDSPLLLLTFLKWTRWPLYDPG